MSGSRLGRGRGGRLALYGCALIIFVIVVYLYRACSIEMVRLQELHVQCSHQQEALAAQLQVIYEYKVRLEKSLQEEKNTNQALKQELQQRVSREKSLRDKDKENVEIVQSYNAMQQKYNILQSENKDIEEECTKIKKQALEESNRLESTLRDLRSEISRAQEDKKKSMENLKTKYLTIQKDYAKMETEYNNLVKNAVNSKSSVLHLEKQVFQLKRELEQAKKSITSPDYVVNRAASQQQEPETNQDKSRAHSANEQVARPSQHKQQNTPAHSVKSVLGSNIESTTKASVVSVSPERSLTAGRTKVKLPIGVVPIPVIINPKLENEEKKTDEKRRNTDAGHNSKVKDLVVESGKKEKAKELDIRNMDLLAHQPAGKVAERQGNVGWLRVQPGVQEIGDEPNHLERLAGMEDGGQQGPDIAEDQYENEEFYREQQPKNNDLRIEEEDEGEDEDDQLDYPNNNLKHEKRE
ncbi:Golgi integral membrane protein 4-like [Belonocnema kinseyi]|uniref:Golgi integral membrane protein 4-like n=1 Tax=Belonocnema kinseyi TaxID=2817044 RepID=UPI00143D35CA|nr:Golgi integral membrane protein 4-like [Belonocnema kinseyi]